MDRDVARECELRFKAKYHRDNTEDNCYYSLVISDYLGMF